MLLLLLLALLWPFLHTPTLRLPLLPPLKPAP
jgi:hypothetical protein